MGLFGKANKGIKKTAKEEKGKKKDITKLEGLLDGLLAQLQQQRLYLGDRLLRMMLKAALKMKRKQYEDKEEFDRIVKEHKPFQAFCAEIGLKL